jgi:mannosyltransferase OCH1-like enzyme
VISKKLHFVWIGDESKRPDHCIDTWKTINPDYEVKVWGNDDLKSHKWFNAKHIQDMVRHELCGVADLMRYEILYNEGGITLDADSVCLAPLEDWLLKPDAFAHWEQETRRLGLINVSVMASVPENPFFGECIERLRAKESLVKERAWITTGPMHITEVYHQTEYPLTVYPSHYFTRDHFSGYRYEGNGHCFATQFWGSTNGYERQEKWTA